MDGAKIFSFFSRIMDLTGTGIGTKLDKLLQSEAPVFRVVEVGSVCCLRTQ